GRPGRAAPRPGPRRPPTGSSPAPGGQAGGGPGPRWSRRGRRRRGGRVGRSTYEASQHRSGPIAPPTVRRVKVSTRGDYASRALLSLALRGSDAGPTSVRDIAERTGLPQPYLEQILLALKGAGIVRSKRGVGGGYVLARPPEEITLGEIVAAVDGPIALGDFGEPHQDGACDHEGQCVLLAVWADIGGQLRRRLDSFRLSDIVAMARGER